MGARAGDVIPGDCWWCRVVHCSIFSPCACWGNPKYLHSKLHVNVCGAGEDLTEMNGVDISLRAISTLFQYSGSFRNL